MENRWKSAQPPYFRVNRISTTKIETRTRRRGVPEITLVAEPDKKKIEDDPNTADQRPDLLRLVEIWPSVRCEMGV